LRNQTNLIRAALFCSAQFALTRRVLSTHLKSMRAHARLIQETLHGTRSNSCCRRMIRPVGSFDCLKRCAHEPFRNRMPETQLTTNDSAFVCLCWYFGNCEILIRWDLLPLSQFFVLVFQIISPFFRGAIDWSIFRLPLQESRRRPAHPRVRRARHLAPPCLRPARPSARQVSRKLRPVLPVYSRLTSLAPVPPLAVGSAGPAPGGPTSPHFLRPGLLPQGPLVFALRSRTDRSTRGPNAQFTSSLSFVVL
jgi:hypothetical protein